MVECLLLQELVTDGVEGDGQTASEEQDKVDGQLVPVVDGKWEVVSGGRAAVVTTPSQGAGSKATGLRDKARENHFLFGFWGRALSSLKY